MEAAKLIIVALLIVLPIRYFLFQPFLVQGTSMEPSFMEGDYLLVDQISYRFRDVERGEVIIFRYPRDPSKRYIKRVIGLPGETLIIERETLYVEIDGEREELDEEYITSFDIYNNKEIELENDEYFVIGDNRASSLDSREWGPLPEENIIGRTFFQISPFNGVFAAVNTPEYEAPMDNN